MTRAYDIPALRVRDRSGKPAGLIARRNDEATGRVFADSPTALPPDVNSGVSAGTPNISTSTVYPALW